MEPKLTTCYRKYKVANFWICCIAAVTFLFSYCKEKTILPSELVPEIDNINTFASDTFSIITHTVYQDSILTGGAKGENRVSNLPTLYHPLGTITDDATFGKTNANIHIEVLPPVTNFNFRTNAPGTLRTIDSIVLSIPLKGTYGDTLNNTNQTIKVHRSLKRFYRDSAQYEFTKDSFDNQLIAQMNINYATLHKDSPMVGGIKLVPQLRIKLNSWFADSLQAQVDLGINGAAADFSKFLDWWKGFYIEADSNSGSTIGYFNTHATRMYIYYRHTNTDLKLDTVVDVFSFDPNVCNRFGNINRNYIGSTSAAFIKTNNPKGDSILFIQNEPGLIAKVQFPYLHEKENVIVNKAELSFYSVSPYNNFADTNKFGLNPRLQILNSDTSDNDKIAEDYALFGYTVVDGTKKTVNIGGLSITRYQFVITYSIQKLISQKNSTFRFKIMGLNSGYPASYRVMVAGSGSKIDELRPKLKIIYTKIK